MQLNIQNLKKKREKLKNLRKPTKFARKKKLDRQDQ